MAVKHYIYSGGEYHTTVLGKGKSYRIHFEPGGEGSICVTGEEEVQKAIESDPRFDRLFSLCMSEEEEKAEGLFPGEDVPDGNQAEKAPQQRMVEEVENISQAREYLKGQGISGNALRTPDAILRKAMEAGISFPHLTLKTL